MSLSGLELPTLKSPNMNPTNIFPEVLGEKKTQPGENLGPNVSLIVCNQHIISITTG